MKWKAGVQRRTWRHQRKISAKRSGEMKNSIPTHLSTSTSNRKQHVSQRNSIRTRLMTSSTLYPDLTSARLVRAQNDSRLSRLLCLHPYTAISIPMSPRPKDIVHHNAIAPSIAIRTDVHVAVEVPISPIPPSRSAVDHVVIGGRPGGTVCQLGTSSP
jgi:hypothetical protein